MLNSKSLKIVALWACLASSVVLAGPDSPELRAAAADKYLVVKPVAEMVDEVLPFVGIGERDAQAREKLLVAVRQKIRMDVLSTQIREALVATFTTDELNALTALYGSADGASAMKKLPMAQGPIVIAIRQELERIAACLTGDAAKKAAAECARS